MLESVGCGGPGVCDMCLSEDGTRLYSLLGEADSILMSDAFTCAPLAVNRCGCNPQNMSCCGDILAVSGGEDGCVYLFSVHTLECIERIPMPGAVCSVLLCEDAVYALCLTTEMNSAFVVCREMRRYVLGLQGMPGCLSVQGESILIATQGKQYLFSPARCCLLDVKGAPGRARRICLGWGRVFLLDALSESILFMENDFLWRCLFTGAKDMFACPPMVQ